MRGWAFASTRNPVWRFAGTALMVGTVAITTLYVIRGPRPLQPSADAGLPAGGGAQGRFGKVTEPLGEGLFVLSYESITGKEEDLQLQKVVGTLQEPQSTWHLNSPAAHKQAGVWTLLGPMDMANFALDGKTELGHGTIRDAGPALGWDKGVWHGLAPLVWDDLQGSGRGRWDLPAGWTRGLDGKFVVDQGPVHWTAAQEGTVRSMDAQRMWAVLGFKEGHLEDVTGHLTGGQVQAKVVDIQEDWIRWSAPISFARDDGWHGTAAGGQAPRPPDGGAFEKVEFSDFRAQRAITGGNESVRSDGARWTPAGLRLEGDVRLEQPLDGGRLVLQAPRVLQRTGPGADLPPDLVVGDTWAEAEAVLSWGNRSLSSPRIEGRQKTRQWKILAPALGRGEQGTFSAGEGRGTPARWEFDGPIQANFGEGSTALGDSLVWENLTYTLVGRPVTVNRFRERLTGPRVVRKGDIIEFPDGIAGGLAALDGDINIQADRGKVQRTLINLDGRVECQGQGWSLQADRISVTLGAGNMVKQVNGNGTVLLRGRMGEGRGDALVLDPNLKTANWLGRVKAVTEVNP